MLSVIEVDGKVRQGKAKGKSGERAEGGRAELGKEDGKGHGRAAAERPGENNPRLDSAASSMAPNLSSTASRMAERYTKEAAPPSLAMAGRSAPLRAQWTLERSSGER